jgi:hypothetical protein
LEGISIFDMPVLDTKLHLYHGAISSPTPGPSGENCCLLWVSV